MEKETIKDAVENLAQLGDALFSSVIPEEAKKHFRQACRETLLGMIAILDHADEMHKYGSSKDSKEEKPTTHTIDITE